jgi:hypothetical protein
LVSVPGKTQPGNATKNPICTLRSNEKHPIGLVRLADGFHSVSQFGGRRGAISKWH